MGPSEDAPDKLPIPAPKEANPLYLLGTAKVDALVSPTADHLDVSIAWRRRGGCIRQDWATAEPDLEQGS